MFKQVQRRASKGVIEIKDFQEKVVVKLLSPSAGMHDRFTASKALGHAQMQLNHKSVTLRSRLLDSADPPPTAKLPVQVLEWLNNNINRHRSAALNKNLKKAGLKKHNRYEDGRNRLFYHDNFNGRPDFILFNDENNIIGVVEAKAATHAVDRKILSQRHKQAAFYQILTGALEAYTIFHPNDGRGNFYELWPVTPTELDRASQKLVTVKENFLAMLDSAGINLN